MRFTFNQKLLLFSTTILTGIVVTGYAVYKSNQNLVESAKLVRHTEQVRILTGKTFSLIQDIQAAVRGYMISGDTVFITNVPADENNTYLNIDSLKRLTTDNPRQQNRIDSLLFYTRLRLAIADSTILLRHATHVNPIAFSPTMLRGRKYSDLIRNVINDIDREENELLDERQKTNEQSAASFNRLSLLLFTVLALLLIASVFAAANYVRQQDEHTQQMQERNARLEEANKQIFKRNIHFDQALDLLCTATVEGYFTDVNKSFEKTLGYTQKELTTIPFLDFVHPDDIAATLKEVEKLATGGTTIKFENRYRCKNGNYVTLQWNTVAYEGLLYAAARDITLQRQQQEELIHQAERINAVNKELEAFSYSVSHDLRAPLRAIHGYTRILHEEYAPKLDAEANRMMNNIMFNAKKMSQLIDDLLNFSRLGRKELSKTQINTTEMVTGVCDEIKTVYPNRQLDFKIHAMHDINADSMIKQIWENLIGNAVKYTGQKQTASIEIKAEAKRNEVVFSVADNGAGFDMRYAGKLFGVFQRLHSEEEFEGTGVGLAIVQRIVNKHGGRVWAEGKVNEGAVFYFSLPRG